MHVWSGVRSFEGAVVLKAPSRDWQHSANAIPGALPEPLRTYAALSISPLRAECTHPRSRVSQSLLPDRLSSHRERVATEAGERAPSGTQLRRSSDQRQNRPTADDGSINNAQGRHHSSALHARAFLCNIKFREKCLFNRDTFLALSSKQDPIRRIKTDVGSAQAA